MSLHNKLFYHVIEFSLTPHSNVNMDGWIGSIIRNNLLYATRSVLCDNSPLSDFIEKFPLPPHHPLYKSYKEGFPKCYSIKILSGNKYINERSIINKGEKLIFSITLIGSGCLYYKEWILAVKSMCERGLGHPMTPFSFISATEKDLQGREQIIAIGDSDKIGSLKYPITIANFEQERFGEKNLCLKLHYLTPVLFMEPGAKKNKEVSYQDKMNGFPSFYQFIRSAAYRYATLAVLYAFPDDLETYNKSTQWLNSYPDSATQALLTLCNIEYITIPGTFRTNNKERIIFKGYIGESIYKGDFTEYTPFLHFMEGIGVGSEVVYGLGDFKLEIIK